jgi:acyl carrier protein
MTDHIDELRAFVIENFLFGQGDGALTVDTSFLQSGIIDSTGLLELIGFVERTYAIHLSDEELVPENLDSLARLSKLVARKIAGEDGRPPCEAAAVAAGGASGVTV